MADRVAAFGGCIAVNRPVDLSTAEAVFNQYAEVVVAPEPVVAVEVEPRVVVAVEPRVVVAVEPDVLVRSVGGARPVRGVAGGR